MLTHCATVAKPVRRVRFAFAMRSLRTDRLVSARARALGGVLPSRARCVTLPKFARSES